MPVTPLHTGIPGLVSYFYPRRVDIFSAILGSVLCDTDFFLYLLFGTPIHGFFHTFMGATVMGIILVVLIRLLQRPVISIKKWFRWETGSDMRSIILGAFLGTFSHVLLDSLIYADMEPFSPVDGNPFLMEGAREMMFTLVYGITGITTFVLLMLYNHKYLASIRAQGTGNDE